MWKVSGADDFDSVGEDEQPYWGIDEVLNDADLADALLASLKRYQKSLKGPPPSSELWNEEAGPVKEWSPKDENNFSDCLARHFLRDMRSLNIHVARESELRQGTAASSADIPDLVVTAPCVGESENGKMLRVIVEAKCSWNLHVVTCMESQLLNRYLRDLQCGIYVTAHFACRTWTDKDYRKTQSLAGKTLQEVTTILQEKRNQMASATTSKRIDSVVIDASI